MENKELWEKIKKPPKEALSKISGGNLNGMSSIDPMWRLQAMTEIFGPCGIGWKYSIKDKWVEKTSCPGKENGALNPGVPWVEASAHVIVELFIKVEGEWSEPIPGIGGSMILAQQRKGGNHSDEAYKMALTDALSVAFKSLGMAADVYMGNFDGTKYNDSEYKLKEPDSLTPELKKALEEWISFFTEIGNPNAAFISANLPAWTKDDAEIWIQAFEKDYRTGI